MMGALDGKVAIVTGAARGIGRAISVRFAREGADVVVADLNEVGARETAGEIEGLGRRALALGVDVTRGDQIAGMVRRSVERFGRIDVLANNAGVVRVERLLDVTEEHWDFVLGVNAKAVFFVLQAVARRMRDQEPGADGLRGRIINTASIAGKPGGRPMFGPYAASKAAVISITQSAAAALAPDITVNCVCPGAVETNMWEQIDAEWGELEGRERGEVWRQRIAPIPLGRPESPEDVAGVFTFLAGPDAAYMTGQSVTVDGGLVMG
jgi:meso-butanediol dehydrogenase/(S,S)-butanediol dehydrogenase/diacetyl reductase